MKNLVLIIVALMLSSAGFSQRVLEWSIGEAEITCGDPVMVSFPLFVSINDNSESPALGSTTMRFIYDATALNNLSIQNIENGYTKSGLSESNPVLGEIFGFSSKEGVFVQFNIMDNAIVNPINLLTTPTHVLDLTFEIDDDAKYPLCTPFVLDNNPDGWNLGISQDDGYVPGSAGIVGSYFLNADYSIAIDADDEVSNLAWENSNNSNGNGNGNDTIKLGKIKKGKKLGKVNKSECIKRNICRGRQLVNLNGQHNISEEEESSFSVFPIPFDHEVTVRYAFDYDTKVILEIFDAKGALVQQIIDNLYSKGVQQQHKIDLTKANYQFLVIRLTTDRTVETKKVISIGAQRERK
jgi:hypothetical protein